MDWQQVPWAFVAPSILGALIFLVLGFAKAVDAIMSWQAQRQRVKDDKATYSENAETIRALFADYRMMTAGREYVAETLDKEIRFYSNWIEQEKGILHDEIGRLVPIQLELIELLSKATTRGRGDIAPAEFRDLVEGGRSGEERRKRAKEERELNGWYEQWEANQEA